MSDAIRSDGMITVRCGWREFTAEVEQMSMYDVLLAEGVCNQSLGCLYLLEEAIGQVDFREICPLVLCLDADNPVGSGLLARKYDVDSVVNRAIFHDELWDRFYSLQWKHARKHWPQGINRWFKDVIEVILRNALSIELEELWRFYDSYLDARYGLSCGKAVRGRACVVVKGMSLSGIKLMGFRIEEVFKVNIVQTILRNAAVHFFRGHEDVLDQIAADVHREFVIAPAEVTLDTALSSIVSVRTANLLEQIGIRHFRDLRGVTEEQIRAIRDVGLKTIRETRHWLGVALEGEKHKLQRERDEFKKLKEEEFAECVST